jgi:hypothetical protein
MKKLIQYVLLIISYSLFYAMIGHFMGQNIQIAVIGGTIMATFVILNNENEKM